MKRIKSKVAVGVVVAGMVASMGTAFAATDAGAQLKGWYSSASIVVKAAVAGDLANYSAGKALTHAATVGSIKSGAQQDIRDAGNAKTNSVKQAINAQATEYANQISGAQASIESSMPGEYDSFVSDTNTVTNAGVDVIGAADKKILADAVKNHKNTYLNRLETGATDTKTAAAQALNTQIANTKAKLNDLLAAEKSAATDEVKANLDSKIAALEAELRSLTDAGVTDAKQAINTKGDQLLSSSLGELDVIVQGINKR